MPLQPMTGGEDQALLLGRGDAGDGAAEFCPGRRRATAHLDEHGRGAVAADQVDFAALDAEIALQQLEAVGEQMPGGGIFAGRAGCLALGHRGAHGVAHCSIMAGMTQTTKNALAIVATPIGNLGDITLRALEILRQADTIACEDTRHARRLLDHHDIRASLLAVHEHNEQAAAARLIELLAAGKRVALISDAGTPGVSDPGARTVAAVRAAGHAVTPLPGPNAAIAALCVAGLDTPAFHFVGFLPAKLGARRTAIEGVKGIAATLVFYEAPHRIEETVADLAALLEPEREIVVARELTKLFEEIVRLPLPEALAWLAADANRRRGEFVLLVSAPPPRVGLDAECERVLKLLLAELPVRQAAKLASEITGAAKNELYRRALELKEL